MSNWKRFFVWNSCVQLLQLTVISDPIQTSTIMLNIIKGRKPWIVLWREYRISSYSDIELNWLRHRCLQTTLFKVMTIITYIFQNVNIDDRHNIPFLNFTFFDKYSVGPKTDDWGETKKGHVSDLSKVFESQSGYDWV